MSRKAKPVEVDETEVQSQVEEIKDFIHSDEFKEIIQKASSHRLSILTSYVPEMKDIKQEFIDYMIESSKVNKEDEVSKEDEKELKKKFGRIFKRLVDYTHYIGGYPRPETPSKLDVLADNVEIALKYLEFAHDQSFKTKLAERGIFIDEKKTKKLTDDYPQLNAETWENFKSMIDDGSDCQGKICSESDKIKNDIFENDLPEEVKFSKENKAGLKTGTFNKMVNAEAITAKVTEDKARRRLSNMSATSAYNIAREQVVTEHLAETIDDLD